MKKQISRRDFFAPAVGTTLLLLLLPGCGGGGDSGLAAAAAGLGGTPGSGCGAQISFNHGHVLAIPTADLDSLTAMTYDIQGSADHSHSVTFSPAQLATLKTDASVTVSSTAAFSHQHDITVSCV